MSQDTDPRYFETTDERRRTSELPDWKAPDMDNQRGPIRWHTGMEDSRDQMPAASTDFTVPTHLSEEDWI